MLFLTDRMVAWQLTVRTGRASRRYPRTHKPLKRAITTCLTEPRYVSSSYAGASPISPAIAHLTWAVRARTEAVSGRGGGRRTITPQAAQGRRNS